MKNVATAMRPQPAPAPAPAPAPQAQVRWAALGVAFAALAGIAWLMPEVAGLTRPGRAALAMGVFAIIVWMTQALDDALSGLVIVFLLAATGAAANVQAAFSGYANTALWLIVIGFTMAGAIDKSGLSKRIALL